MYDQDDRLPATCPVADDRLLADRAKPEERFYP